MATAAGASTRLFWEAGGVRHPLENCSTGCLNERLDPCVDAVRVSQRYVESLAAGGPFRCEYDWPPWPEHLMPKVHFSPPQMAHVAPHDVAAAVTIEGAASCRTRSGCMGLPTAGLRAISCCPRLRVGRRRPSAAQAARAHM